MEALKNILTKAAESFKKPHITVRILFIIVLFSILCFLISIPVYLLLNTKFHTKSEQIALDESRECEAPPPTSTPPLFTDTPDPNYYPAGTYLVGVDIQPGLYKGSAGTDFSSSCYWKRISDDSGMMSSIIASDIGIGQYYLQIVETDFAVETECVLQRLKNLPAPPVICPDTILPGTYLVNIDIQPGFYQGKAGFSITDSCYWERLSDVDGEPGSIIDNDVSIGRYTIQVTQDDFALTTSCSLTRISNKKPTPTYSKENRISQLP